MTTYFSKDVLNGLDVARRRSLKRGSRLRVVVDGNVYPILRMTKTGFSVATGDVPPLRGVVDVHDGARMLSRCLIVTSDEADGETRYEFKRQTRVTDGPALDFERKEGAPAALLPRL